MNKSEWHDETLLAIFATGNNTFEVWELPARAHATVSKRGRIFRTEDKAEAWIADQFDASDVLRVSADDILEEIKWRVAYLEERPALDLDEAIEEPDFEGKYSSPMAYIMACDARPRW